MAIKRIFSAGGIVLRLRSGSSIRKDESGWEVLVTQHSKHKGWDFPKGHREIYESEDQTALREVEEETGVKAEIIERVGETKYFYYEEGERVLKTVAFYLMKYVSQGKSTTAFEVSGTKWLAPDEVKDQLTFRDTKELWKRVRTRIESLLKLDGSL